MSKVTNLDDYRGPKDYRAVKKQRRARLMDRIDAFLTKTARFFELANTRRHDDGTEHS